MPAAARGRAGFASEGGRAVLGRMLHVGVDRHARPSSRLFGGEEAGEWNGGVSDPLPQSFVGSS